MSHKGVVAAGHKLTLRVAENILRDGGNAFDAILAAHFAACVTEPILASLGGGGFMIAKARDAEPVVYDFFVQTPRHKRPVDESGFRPILADFGTTQQEFHIGQGTIATPGSVKGLFEIHRDLASMPMKDIVAPAVQYARDGVTVNGIQAYIFDIVSPICMATPEAREVFCNGALRDRVVEEGDTMHQPQLADTFEQLAVEGEELFYRGEIGREIVKHCQDEGGNLTHEDLEQYEVMKRKPLDVEYSGSHVLTNPPPSSGGILIAFALELLKASNPIRADFGSTPYLRLLAEVMALTNKARLDTLDNQQEDSRGRLLDPRYLDRYREEVAHRAQAIRGTTQFSVIDAQGNAASMTVSNGEGCGSIVPGTGIMLNNMLGEQDLNVSGFHLWNENERMTSMMAPSLIQTGDGTLVATGSGGSNRIRTALLQVMMNLVHFGMDVSQAVLSPRIHLEGDKLSVEGGFSASEVEPLIAEFPEHQVWPERNLFFGGAHTVMVKDGVFTGAGDPRRDGVCRVVK
jgi:gamma-glutamyltranspeptidase/glutathione hydrolase